MPGDIRKKREGKEQVENPPDTQSSWGELSFAQQREILYPTEGQKSDRSKGAKAKVDVDAFFKDTFVSLMEKQGISIPPDELLPFDRHTPIHEIAEPFGKDFAISFIISCGKAIDKKCEQATYRKDASQKFKGYDNKVTLISDSLFEVKSSSDDFTFTGRIDPGEDSSITIIDVKREKGSQALFLGEALGELWQYVLSKIASGKDDMGTTINIDASNLSKYPKKLHRTRIENPETKARIRQLLQGKMQKPGIIAITRNSEGVWTLGSSSSIKPPFNHEEIQNLAVGVLATPHGYASAFLPKQYKHVFGDIERTQLQIKLAYNSSDIVDIEAISFHFDKSDRFK
ncbi:hypothetical protein KSF_034960 [Reticulibacter mediterranei]|uniref:Uncharacterized protein n=1 Tax=Reticulibacter mediterranei TaxID=2778369 RepID=A0A8J3IJ80_9CHLR|nr:hypothetical protein [Reticulibacter mediterranei]GHO93448.1 hypothetical protein KSF_034960 [Reticulibacter mediterranei]